MTPPEGKGRPAGGLTRRAVLSGGLALSALGTGPARAQVATRFRAVNVDVSPLDRFGGGGARNVLAPILLQEMRRVFGDLIGPDPRAPLLTARITHIYLTPYDGFQSIDGIGANDNIEGDGIVTTGGRVLSSTHVLTELRAAYSGSIVTPNLDLVRHQSIAYQFAWWLRREMGL